MFAITKALYAKLYKAYDKQKKITCVRGKSDNPDSYFTNNISFSLDSDGNTAIVKSKFGKQASFTNSLMKWVNDNHQTQLIG